MILDKRTIFFWQTLYGDKGSLLGENYGGTHPRGGSWGIFRVPPEIDILLGGQLYINAFYHLLTLTGRKMV